MQRARNSLRSEPRELHDVRQFFDVGVDECIELCRAHDHGQRPLLRPSGLNIRPFITHRLPYTLYGQAFEILGRGQSGKVVMNWESG